MASSTSASCCTNSKCARCMPNPWYTWPTFLFLAACGGYFIVAQMLLSKAPDRFLEVHKASKVPLSLTHNTLHLVDAVLTPLISFFVSAFGDTTSAAYPTVVDFVWSFGAAILMPLIEAERIGVDGRRCHKLAITLLSHPMWWGILYQRLSGGLILPLWLIAFMLSPTRANGAGIERAKAESVLFGWLFGHTVPAIAMLIPNQPAFTQAPIWIAFPILMTAAQWAYYVIRTQLPYIGRTPSQEVTKRLHGSGYVPIMLLYLSAFVGSCAAHFHIVIIPGLAGASCTSPTSLVLLNKFIGLARFLYTFFVPATGLRVPTPAETTAVTGVVHFVQFDIIVVFSAVWIALIWDLSLRRQQPGTSTLESATWAAKTFVILFFTGLALGPGAATAGLLAYRESLLEEGRQASEKTAIPIQSRSTLSSTPSSASTRSSTPRSGRYHSPMKLSPVKAWQSPISPMNRQVAVF